MLPDPLGKKNTTHSFAQHKWLQLYEAISSNNHKSICSLVTRINSPPFNNTPPPISPSVWVAHFSGIFFATDSCEPFYLNLPVWPPVTPDEVVALINTLKPDKSPGPDDILNQQPLLVVGTLI